MTTDIARRDPAHASLTDKMTYAERLAKSGLLPKQYTAAPANILWAIEYGEALGLSTMAAITGVHVIGGKPSASAALISGLVRRAGHQLRVTGDRDQATATIVRSDDPDFTFKVTFTIDDARTAGLLDGPNRQVWKNYPGSMLKARATTQVARDACEEILFGLHYTPEELGAATDADGNIIETQPRAADGWAVAPLNPNESRLATLTAPTSPPIIEDAEVVSEDPVAESARTELVESLTGLINGSQNLDELGRAAVAIATALSNGSITTTDRAPLLDRHAQMLKKLTQAQAVAA